MAQKRMFDKRITDSDRFMDLPNSSKALYFMAGMAADDRGFFQPRRLQKMCGFTDDDFKVLIAKKYFIPFESGVMVITDWNKNNYLDKNRLTETEYVDELHLLRLINEKYELDNSCLTSVKPMFNQNSIEENRIEENRIVVEDKINNINNINNNILNISETASATADIKNKLQEEFVCCTGSTNLNSILECISYLNDLPFEVIQIALKKTADVNGSWKYAKSILNKWVKGHIDTIEKVQAEDLNFRKNKEPRKETEAEAMERKIRQLEEAMKNGD